MPVIQMPSRPDRSDVPILGQPARVEGMTLVVVVVCLQCPAGEMLALVNAQPAVCPSCGARVSLNSLDWDAANPVPRISMSATRPLPNQISQLATNTNTNTNKE